MYSSTFFKIALTFSICKIPTLPDAQSTVPNTKRALPPCTVRRDLACNSVPILGLRTSPLIYMSHIERLNPSEAQVQPAMPLNRSIQDERGQQVAPTNAVGLTPVQEELRRLYYLIRSVSNMKPFLAIAPRGRHITQSHPRSPRLLCDLCSTSQQCLAAAGVCLSLSTLEPCLCVGSRSSTQ